MKTIAKKLDIGETSLITFEKIAPIQELETVIDGVTYTLIPATADEVTTWTAIKKDDTTD